MSGWSERPIVWRCSRGTPAMSHEKENVCMTPFSINIAHKRFSANARRRRHQQCPGSHEPSKYETRNGYHSENFVLGNIISVDLQPKWQRYENYKRRHKNRTGNNEHVDGSKKTEGQANNRFPNEWQNDQQRKNDTSKCIGIAYPNALTMVGETWRWPWLFIDRDDLRRAT